MRLRMDLSTLLLNIVLHLISDTFRSYNEPLVISNSILEVCYSLTILFHPSEIKLRFIKIVIGASTSSVMLLRTSLPKLHLLLERQFILLYMSMLTMPVIMLLACDNVTHNEPSVISNSILEVCYSLTIIFHPVEIKLRFIEVVIGVRISLILLRISLPKLHLLLKKQSILLSMSMPTMPVIMLLAAL